VGWVFFSSENCLKKAYFGCTTRATRECKTANWANSFGILALGGRGAEPHLHPMTPSVWLCLWHESIVVGFLSLLAGKGRTLVCAQNRSIWRAYIRYSCWDCANDDDDDDDDAVSKCLNKGNDRIRDATIRIKRQRLTLCLSVCLSVYPSVWIALRPATETLTSVLYSSERLQTANNRC